MDLVGKLLVAMPAMQDPRFEHAVILLCAHSDDGAMGIIINKPVQNLNFDGLLENLNITRSGDNREIVVHFGGPVERSRGFVLHSPDYKSAGTTMHIEGGYGMTGTLDVLEALANGEGPAQALLALGYSGWGPGQLESEIGRNDWLTVDPNEALIFDTSDADKWSGALRGMGIDPLSLSATSGRA